jgi:hypothetical protein
LNPSTKGGGRAKKGVVRAANLDFRLNFRLRIRFLAKFKGAQAAPLL